MRNDFKFLAESETSQSETVFKSLTRFSTQFSVKESFKHCYLLHKLRKCGDQLRNSLATKKNLEIKENSKIVNSLSSIV